MSEVMGWISGIFMLIVWLVVAMYLPFCLAMGPEWRARHGLLGEARKTREGPDKRGGCPCGCRGDYHPADECYDRQYCCGTDSTPEI